MVSIDDSWKRIHEWMEDNSAQMLELLKQKATQLEIKELEDLIEVYNLPEDFKRSYGIHNGSTASTFFGTNVAFSFYSIEDIVREWRALKVAHPSDHDNAPLQRDAVAHPEIKNLIWSERWIPFGGDNHGNFICIDLDPAVTGRCGQVIHWFSGDEAPILCASSFENYLKGFADDMAVGKYSLFQEENKLIYTEFDNDP